MSRRPVKALKLHDALAGRVEALAKARGLTAASLLSTIVADAIKAGEITADVPGFGATGFTKDSPEVMRGPAVRLVFGAAHLPEMHPAFARDIADMIHGLTVGRGRDAAQGRQVAPETNLAVFRKGTGLIFAVTVTGHDDALVSTLPLSMGLDLANMIRHAANDAQGITAEQAAELEALGA